MSAILVLLLTVVAGGTGATLRYIADRTIKNGIFIVNIIGSFLAGFVVSFVGGSSFSDIIGVGFLGGFTTFSTASLKAVEIALELKYLRATAYGFGTLVLSVGFALFGFLLGSWIGALISA